MLIPYGSDTPIYYWPFATAVLIAVNIVAYPLQYTLPSTQIAIEEMVDLSETDVEDPLAELLAEGGLTVQVPGYYRLALSHGDGLHPLQWLTSFFIHGGVFHLLGNMIFLWSFGLIVEGKVGPLLFTALYLGIGLFQNMVEQIIFLPFPTGPSLGASSAIYGIMMIALLWAPQDNVKCMGWFWFYIWLIDIPIFMFGLIYFLWDFTVAMFSDFAMGTALLHVMGAVVGFIPGVAFLVLFWVDGEQRDLISMIREVVGAKPLRKKKTQREIRQQQQNRQEQALDRQQTIERTWKSMDVHLAAGNTRAAKNLFRQIRKLDPDARWNEPVLLRLIRRLMQEENWKDVVQYSKVYINEFDSRANPVKLNLAKIYLLHEESPRRAIKAVQSMDRNRLTEKEIQTGKQIIVQAQKMIADGVMELGDD